ncbi:MAG: hypothetical protein L0G23_05410 [Ruaniaceae bacterium]|nr:hypothetical protein [Ruaniaceae bacterium]
MTALHERPTLAGTPLEGLRVISGKANDDELAAILAVTLMEGSVPEEDEPAAKPTEWMRRARLGVRGSQPSWRWSRHP